MTRYPLASQALTIADTHRLRILTMSLQNLLKQFTGSSNAAPASSDSTGQGIGEALRHLSGSIPGGLAGGAAAGGLMALLMGNKSARKFAGKAATVGGAAMLGGLAYKAYQQWQNTSSGPTASQYSADNGELPEQEAIAPPDRQHPALELTLVKAMIAAAKADGQIDDEEQRRIFDAVEQMELSAEIKGQVFDCLRQTISVEELVREVRTLEQKSEIYLASCMVINLDHPSERAYLNELASALALPLGLSQQLLAQAQQAAAEAV